MKSYTAKDSKRNVYKCLKKQFIIVINNARNPSKRNNKISIIHGFFQEILENQNIKNY